MNRNDVGFAMACFIAACFAFVVFAVETLRAIIEFFQNHFWTITGWTVGPFLGLVIYLNLKERFHDRKKKESLVVNISYMTINVILILALAAAGLYALWHITTWLYHFADGFMGTAPFTYIILNSMLLTVIGWLFLLLKAKNNVIAYIFGTPVASIAITVLALLVARLPLTASLYSLGFIAGLYKWTESWLGYLTVLPLGTAILLAICGAGLYGAYLCSALIVTMHQDIANNLFKVNSRAGFYNAVTCYTLSIITACLYLVATTILN